MPRLPLWPTGQVTGEQPGRPFTGYKLAHAVMSADDTQTGFAGLTLGATHVYRTIGDAACVWNRHHAPPRRWCGCGFYCLHDLADARSLACATENRSALLLEVAASGRYIRYERGLRYSRQRVRAILDARCGCGRAGVSLTDAGSGLIGWRHLAPACRRCTRGRAALTLQEFAARLDRPLRIAPLLSASPLAPVPGEPVPGEPVIGEPVIDEAEQSPIAVLTAEIALLHARLDDLQSRLGR